MILLRAENDDSGTWTVKLSKTEGEDGFSLSPAATAVAVARSVVPAQTDAPPRVCSVEPGCWPVTLAAQLSFLLKNFDTMVQFCP